MYTDGFWSAHEHDGRRTLSAHAAITGSTLRLILRSTGLPFPIAARIGVSRLWPSGNCSLNLPRKRQKCRRIRGVKQYRRVPIGRGESAGRTLETPGSTCDLIVHDQGGVPGVEIDTPRPILDRHD